MGSEIKIPFLCCHRVSLTRGPPALRATAVCALLRLVCGRSVSGWWCWRGAVGGAAQVSLSHSHAVWGVDSDVVGAHWPSNLHLGPFS